MSRKLRKRKTSRAHPSAHGLILYLLHFPCLPFFPFQHIYLGVVENPPAGFLIVSLYALSSSMTQNHSAISHVGSSLWSLGGFTQIFAYALGSSMVICNSNVS